MGKVTQDRGCSIVGTERERGDTKIATEGEVSGGAGINGCKLRLEQ
jgi:hypothetical protein